MKKLIFILSSAVLNFSVGFNPVRAEIGGDTTFTERFAEVVHEKSVHLAAQAGIGSEVWNRFVGMFSVNFVDDFRFEGFTPDRLDSADDIAACIRSSWEAAEGYLMTAYDDLPVQYEAMSQDICDHLLPGLVLAIQEFLTEEYNSLFY